MFYNVFCRNVFVDVIEMDYFLGIVVYNKYSICLLLVIGGKMNRIESFILYRGN